MQTNNIDILVSSLTLIYHGWCYSKNIDGLYKKHLGLVPQISEYFIKSGIIKFVYTKYIITQQFIIQKSENKEPIPNIWYAVQSHQILATIWTGAP